MPATDGVGLNASFGFEAAAEVMRWAAGERGLERVGSNVQTPNEASHRILRRLGFTFTGTRPVPRDPSRSAHWYVWTAPTTAKTSQIA